MKFYSLLSITALVTLLSSQAYAASVQEEDLVPTKIFDAYEYLNKANSGGVYRVIDKNGGSVVYVFTTGRSNGQPQMEVVPFGMLDETTRKNILK